MIKTEYRVYREARVTDENDILDPVLIDSFCNMDDAHNLVLKLVKEDGDDFAHEFFYTAKYDFKVFTSDGAKDWIFDENFGKLFSNPRSAKGILYSKQ